MKHLTLITRSILLLFIIFLGACQKEEFNEIELFDIEAYTGRYDFSVKTEIARDGKLTTEFNTIFGYLHKESAVQIKLLFNFNQMGVDCSYDYYVRPDGTLVSNYKGAGERTGSFLSNGIEFAEIINLDNGDYKMVEIEGYKLNN